MHTYSTLKISNMQNQAHKADVIELSIKNRLVYFS